MNNFLFENRTKVFFGKDCVKKYLSPSLCTKDKTIMIAYGGGSVKKHGIYQTVAELMENDGRKVVEFGGIMPNPTYEKVLEGAKVAKENKVDVIFALGGGSVIDCCKAISLAAVSEEDIWENFWAKPGLIEVKPIPIVAILTLAGTGSECNGGAVITNTATNVKTGRDYPQLNPYYAFIDPEYTYTVSAFQTASGGFDTLSHIMETYFSAPDEDNVSDDISEALMKSVIKNLPIAIENPCDYTARSNLLWASTMGENRIIKLGKKGDFQAHQIEHQLGAYTDCNHGAGLAVIHPVYYKHIYKEGLVKFVRFATNVWGIERENKSDEELALAGIEALANFIKSIGLPTTLRELNIPKDVLKAVADSCFISAGSYKKMSNEEILQILNECY